MKTIYRHLAVLMLLMLGISACQKDEHITLQGLSPDTEVELLASEDNVTLTSENTSNLAVQFAWTVPDIWLSEYSLAENVLTHWLEFSLSESFSDAVTADVSGTSQSYTGGSFNSIVNKLNMEADTPTPVYIRLATSAGNNTTPTYSNTVTITTSTYAVDYSVMQLILKSNSETFASIWSPNEDGEYRGFANAPGTWVNFYFRNSDGLLYGNSSTAGAFVMATLASDPQMYNCWFPATSGCHYVTMSLNNMEWTATAISAMNVTGDVTGALTFSSAKNQWSGVITTTAANSNIQLALTGTYYDKTTGDAAGTSKPLYLSGNGSATSGSLTLSESAPSENITIANAGTYTLTVDLSDAKNYTYTLTEGEAPKPTWPDALYIHAKEQADVTYASLADRNDTGLFTGFYRTAGNWENFYFTSATTFADGTVYGYTESSGSQYTLSSMPGTEFNVETLWALWFDTGDPLYYYIQANLDGMSWTPKQIDGFAVCGDFNNWNPTTTMTYDNDTKCWTATFTTPGEEWGFEIRALVNGVSADNSWEYKMRAVESTNELDWDSANTTFKGNASTNIPAAEAGTYTLTIDLNDPAKFTYTIVKQ